MATAKAKTAVKKTAAKTAPKTHSKAPVKKAAPKAKAPKVVAKAAPVKKAKPVVHTKPVVQAKAVAKPVAHKPQPQKVVPPKNESVFARLLREKAERHEKFQKQNEHHAQAHDQRLPHNHASFAKFAGPRRRAS